MNRSPITQMHVNELYPRWLVACEEKNHSCCIVDVRTAQEYAEVHVPGAQLLPLDELSRRLKEIPTGSDIHLICRSGMRSQKAAGILAEAGFSSIYNIEGGTMAWVEVGYPVSNKAQPDYDQAA